MEALKNAFLDFRAITQLFDTQAVLYIVLALIMLFVAKLINALVSPYKLDHQLTTVDNKAVALPFAAFLFSVALILWGILTSESDFLDDLWTDLLSTSIWALIGILLLLISRIINDKLLLSKFDNRKELIDDRNVGTGAVVAGTYIGTALLISVSVTGVDEVNFGFSLLMTFIYFILGQLAFIAFGWIYQKSIGFDVHDEIEQDNVAAGVSFGLSLVAIAILLSGYLRHMDSIPGLIVWFFISAFLLVACRILVDKVVLPGSVLDKEISKDRNWGAALIEGFSVIGLALIIIGAFD